ncbi:MAG: hypothetical protein J6034_07955, partial [Bacteroidaceae bacterium]|nr:hypothetical protein [Bacteroidaceae bacterium]
ILFGDTKNVVNFQIKGDPLTKIQDMLECGATGKNILVAPKYKGWGKEHGIGNFVNRDLKY